jgi:hypothetical protein
LGGAKISSEISDQYLEFLKVTFTHSNQNTDLCAYFFRQGFAMIDNGNYIGMVATNTIGEGDTRETGLEVILNNSGRIVFTDKYVTWSGDASVEVNLLSIRKEMAGESNVNTPILLDGKSVNFISSWLDDLPEVKPEKLFQNKRKAFL